MELLLKAALTVEAHADQVVVSACHLPDAVTPVT
jgi:hypothetical protein